MRPFLAALVAATLLAGSAQVNCVSSGEAVVAQDLQHRGIRVRTVLCGYEPSVFMAVVNAESPASHDEAGEIIFIARSPNEGEIVIPFLNKCATHGIWLMPRYWVEAHLGSEA